jgi:MazG family protein
MSAPPGARFDRLVAIMHTLRAPGGCPWDREQTLATLRPFVLEETCELLDAIDAEDMQALREELGDFLFEAVFIAELCAEAGHFTIGDSIEIVTEKLVRRHPHVFTPDGERLADLPSLTPGGVKAQWDDIKAGERETAGKPPKPTLGGIPRSLPALHRAHELSRRAAAVGFDWAQATDVLAKIDEEVRELREAVSGAGTPAAAVEEELGDVLFAIANVARKMGLDAETALRKASDKFQARFETMERTARGEGRTLTGMTAEELDARWTRAKRDHEGTKEHEGHEERPC